MSTMLSLQSRRLIFLGLLLFLFGLLTGFVSGSLANPRMGLSAHLEGLMNGMMLVLLGIIWPRLSLGATALKSAFGLLVYAAFANWGALLLAAICGAGASSLPIAGQGMAGSSAQESFIMALLLTLGGSIVAGIILVMVGLWRAREGEAT